MFVNPTLDEVAHAVDGDRAHARAAARRRGARRSPTRSRAARARRSSRPPASPAPPTCSRWSASAPTSTCSTPPSRACAAAPGSTWDWSLAAQRRSKIPMILAGGLTAENVADAIAAVRPYAVDVASGVEAEPGIKDPAKLEAFLADRLARAGGRLVSAAPVEHRFGPYGGQYVPETLMPALTELEAAWVAAREDPALPGRSSARCCATSPGARRRSTTPSGSRTRSATPCTSSARTCSTPARTRSTTRSASACSPCGWARRASSPRPARASTASRPRPPARCSASSASSTWAPRTCAARSPTSSGWG